MSIRKTLVGMGPVASILLLMTGAASATDLSAYTFAREIKSCVAEVGQRANYDGAARVRHEVVEVEPALLGYALTIDTSVFTESADVAIREYASYCEADREYKPRRFRISQTGRDS